MYLEDPSLLPQRTESGIYGRRWFDGGSEALR